MKGGDLDGGIWTVGQSQGLIHDIPTCKEMVRNVMAQAEAIIAKRIDKMATGQKAESARVALPA
jgi:nitronate monooxygenase